jgi:hypothetical protein
MHPPTNISTKSEPDKEERYLCFTAAAFAIRFSCSGPTSAPF